MILQDAPIPCMKHVTLVFALKQTFFIHVEADGYIFNLKQKQSVAETIFVVWCPPSTVLTLSLQLLLRSYAAALGSYELLRILEFHESCVWSRSAGLYG